MLVQVCLAVVLVVLVGLVRIYFDNTAPSGPYRQRPGQHVWTDGSKIETEDAQLVGAGLVGYMPSYEVHYFRVG
eukprot:1649604-Rhodomonas_salina.1